MSKFKVGDKVRAINESYGWGEVKYGDVGVVTDWFNLGDYFVEFPNQELWTCTEKDIDLVKPEITKEGHRSLADIKRIAELEKERNSLLAFIIKRIPSIKALSTTSEICKIIGDEVDSLLEAHNLRQQAKGIENGIRLTMMSYTHTNSLGLMKYAKKLNKQADKLEQGE